MSTDTVRSVPNNTLNTVAYAIVEVTDNIRV